MKTCTKALKNNGKPIKNNVKPIHIYFDTEYEMEQLIIAQVLIDMGDQIQKKLLIVPDTIYILYKKNIDLTILSSDNIVLVIQEKNQPISDIVFNYINTMKCDIQKCFFHFYYSPRDLEYYFGQSLFLTLVREKKIDSKTNLKGDFFIEYNGKPIQIKLQDKAGWGKRGGLKQLCETFGIIHKTKSDLDDYKTNMTECCKTPSLMTKLIQYGMEDAWVLKEIHKKMLEYLTFLMTSLLGIPKELKLFFKDCIPSTVGSIVAQIIEAFIYKEFSTNLSNGCKTKEKEFLTLFKTINKKISVDPAILKGTGKKYKNTNRISDLLNGCGINSIGYLYRNSTGILNALVQGGRTFNEQSWDYQKKFIRDIDIAGCYGAALESFVYPIRLPTIVAFTDLNQCCTLKQFLKKYKNELVDNLYTITIKGKLSFSQSLLYSKITDSIKMKKTFDEILNQDGDIHQVNAGFVLLEQELENTILTSDILDTLYAVCDSHELSEIMNCKVLTAAFYKKSDEIKDKIQWLEHMKVQNPTDFSFTISTQSIHDTRSRKWCSIKLDSFFRPLIQERKKLKKLMVEDPKNEYLYNAEQEFIKLIINTFYGVIASAFFRVGNTIQANNITARARNSVWLYSRVLNGIQSITDGFAYQPDFVNIFKDTFDKRPGLQTLSDLRLLQNHRSIKQVSLGGLNWAEIIQNDDLECVEFEKSDGLAMAHINNFLSHYDLKMNYQLEHKPNNIDFIP